MRDTNIFSYNGDFELYKSNICHLVKEKGDIEFIKEMNETDTIENCFLNNRNKEGFYLLAMVDYLCTVNELPEIRKLDQYRQKKLKNPVFPRGVLLLSILSDPEAKEKAIKNAIPEFLKYNIVEGNIRDAY